MEQNSFIWHKKWVKCKTSHGKSEEGEFGSLWSESLRFKCGTLIMLEPRWKNYLYKKIKLKKFALKICFWKITFMKKKIHWKIVSHTKMLHLKLFWALDIKLIYENFPFPLGKNNENDYIIKDI